MNMDKENLIIALVYVDDIIFGRNNDGASHKFAQNMSKEFEMSLIGEFYYFIGLQVTQTKADQ